jgi:cytochrome oxidase Cu insertion factor (SCO1/SenC/PrrC family)
MRMRPIAPVLLLAAALLLAIQSAARQQPQQPTIAHTQLKVGDMAPDFTLPDQNRNPVKLSDFRGKKNVVLAFYVLAFTGG